MAVDILCWSNFWCNDFNDSLLFCNMLPIVQITIVLAVFTSSCSYLLMYWCIHVTTTYFYHVKYKIAGCIVPSHYLIQPWYEVLIGPLSIQCEETRNIVSDGKLRPRPNGHHFDTFKCIFLNENIVIFIQMSLKFAPKGPTNDNS